MKIIKILLLLISFTILSYGQPVPIPSIEFSPKKYVCYRADWDINIDGKLNEAAWTKAVWTDDFVDIEGPLKPVPRFRTHVKMLWDEKCFYIAAEIQEPDIWATLRNRDTIIFYDNDFEIFIDPDGDTHRYCEFEMNAFNTFWDLLLFAPYRDTKNAAVNSFDIKGLKTAISINGTINTPGDKDNSWIVEIAFPWESFGEIADIKIPPMENDQWRINFSRVEWKTEVKNNRYIKVLNPDTKKPFPEDNWVWSPQGVVNMHYPEMWGYVQFTNQLVGGKSVSFIEKSEEQAKWLLRRIYYKEREYFEKFKTFTTNLRKSGMSEKSIPGYINKPKIECTSDCFQASLFQKNNAEKISIRNDGLIWKSPAK
jgi:hypothetical protein